MRYYVILIVIIYILSAQTSSSQYYDTGEDPSSLKWLQIKTSRFTVIYPKSYGAGGEAFAQALDEAYSNLGALSPEKKYKIPVVIHNFTTQSNGYVAWAPRRMEIYPTPAQNTIPLDNEKQLAIHELAHVKQMESLNRGFTRALSILLGEQTTGMIAALLPLWFFEGEAVFAETSLTESGRGRSPSFQKQLKAIAVEKGGMYKYDKVLNGSYRDYIPDHYQSGYQIVTWAKAKYDRNIWNKVLNYTGDQPFTLNPSNICLTKNIGLTKRKLFDETFDSLRTIWGNDVFEEKAINYETVNPDKKGQYINYYSPVFAGNDSIIAIKTSLSTPPSFVLIKPSERSEKKIHTPGQLYPFFISFGNGKLVWVETQPDPRWNNRDYSVIKLMDLKTGKITRLSRKSRYLAASVSPNGRTIGAIENTASNKNNLVILDAETGTVLRSLPAPGNVYLQHPQWSSEGDRLTVIYLTEGGEGIMSFNIITHQWITLVEAGPDDLQSSFLKNDSLIFISSRSGTDNIYLQSADHKITDLTRSRFGVSDLYFNGERVFFSDYSSDGNSICSIKLDNDPGSIKYNVSSKSFLINRFENKPQLTDNYPTTEYKSVPYRKWNHLFKFHSWMPFYADIEEIKSDPASIRPGASIMTQNHLSTLTSTIGYEYSKDKNHVFHSRVTWKGWYPVIESHLDYGNNAQIFKAGEPIGDPSEIQAGLRFSNAVSIPLSFSSGNFSQFVRSSFTTDYRNDYIYDREEGIYDYGQTLLSGRLYISNYSRSAQRDIYPKLAQTIDLNYLFAPFDSKIYGTAFTIKTSFYFPGIFHNNGIRLRIEKEKQVTAKFLFGNSVNFPRGYKNINSQELEFLSVDYYLPLAYPDFNISSLVYLKRIRTGLFYDYGRGTGNTYFVTTSSGLLTNSFISGEESFRSFGFELLADFHILRIPFLISGGFQTAWKNLNESPSFEVIFNIDLFGMTLGKRQL